MRIMTMDEDYDGVPEVRHASIESSNRKSSTEI